jgi:hypothetical protein
VNLDTVFAASYLFDRRAALLLVPGIIVTQRCVKAVLPRASCMGLYLHSPRPTSLVTTIPIVAY